VQQQQQQASDSKHQLHLHMLQRGARTACGTASIRGCPALQRADRRFEANKHLAADRRNRSPVHAAASFPTQRRACVTSYTLTFIHFTQLDLPYSTTLDLKP
jgi:hypothetical protein